MAKRTIYNPDLKERFIKEEVSSDNMKRLFRNVFEYASKYEEKNDADLCTWNKDQTQELLESLAGFRSYSSDNRAKLLKRYVRWCCEEGVEGVTDYIFTVTVDTYKKIKERTLSDPGHLQRCLNSFLSPEPNKTVDNILRGYCWLAYMGLSEEEIQSVTVDDVDLNNGIVKLATKVYIVPNEAFVCLRILKEASEFRYYHSEYSKDYIWRDRAAGDKLLRGLRNPEPNIRNMRSMLSKKTSGGDTLAKLSYSRVFLSGEFYRMYQKEQNGLPVDFIYLGERSIRMRAEKDKPYKLESEKGRRTENGKKRELAREYEQDYIRWKEAYHS